VPVWQSGAVPVTNRIPAVWLVVTGIISVQVGAAIAKDLFDLVPPTAMVWLRLITSAVILLLVARPRWAGHSGRDWLIVLGFGVSLLTMNWAIYQSFARIPLGIAVTIEFLGPLTLAVIGSRRLVDLIWVALAGAGVALLGLSRATLTFVGVGFALLAAVAWACYILLSAQTGRHWPGISGIAIASMVCAIALAPPAILEAGSVMLDSTVLALGLAVGLLSSVIPYSFELIALRRILPRVFSILMSLEPAAAALAAMIVLGEFLTLVQWLAMACVVIASIGATRTSSTLDQPAPD
jgi:inner membrane transporter RhtA